MIEATPTGARTVARLARHVEVALAGCELSVPQYRLLSLLSEGSVNASTLARRLVVSRPSVTALVDGLVARGMVERGTDPADRRHVTHLVTERGEAVLAAADRTAAARLQDLAIHLSPDDVPAARAGLAAWGRALDSYRDTAARARHWPQTSPTGDSMPPTTSQDTHAPSAGEPGSATATAAAAAPDAAALAAQAAATGMLGAFWASVQPDATAIRSAQRDLTFAELNARTNQLARALRARGVRAGDSISLICSNRPEFVETLYAAQRTGLRITPVNWHLTPDEMNYILRDSGAAAVVVDGRFAETVAQALDGVDARALLVVEGSGGPFEDYEQALAAESDENIEDPVLGTSMAYTSGTTGRPKGVHRSAAPAAGAAASELATLVAEASAYVPGQDLNLVTGPLYHSAPLLFSLSMPLSRGAGVVLMDKWDAEETLRLIEQHRITHTHLVPTMFHRMISLPQEVKDRYDVSSLRNIWHGAAPCPVPVKQALMEWLGPIAWEYYAATEGFGSVVSPQDWLARPGTVGLPSPGHIRILDESGADLPAGVPGTIYLRAPDTGRFVYLGDEAKTSSSYLGDYYTLGDVGYLDPDGWLFLTDRSVDLIISGGVNVYPAEVEAVLITHPSVGDVGVIGVPDPEWGESVKAVVELQPGHEPTAELSEELLAWARERLAHFKCPRTVDFVEELPRTPSGKLSKRALRENFRQRVDAGTDA